MGIEFGTANVEKRESQLGEPYDYSQKDNTCTVAKMRATWGEPKVVKADRVIGMVDLIKGKSRRKG